MNRISRVLCELRRHVKIGLGANMCMCACPCVLRICTHAHFTAFDKVYRHLVCLSVSKQSATYEFPRNGSAYVAQYLDTFSAVFMIRSAFFLSWFWQLLQVNAIWFSAVRIQSIQLMCVCASVSEWSCARPNWNEVPSHVHNAFFPLWTAAAAATLLCLCHRHTSTFSTRSCCVLLLTITEINRHKQNAPENHLVHSFLAVYQMNAKSIGGFLSCSPTQPLVRVCVFVFISFRTILFFSIRLDGAYN